MTHAATEPEVLAMTTVRQPDRTDAGPVFDIVSRCELDDNSRYAYALWCLEFADTMAVAEHRGRVVGFAMCFPRPADPERLFLWQIGVDQEFRGYGIAQRMLDFVQAGRYRYVECTVTPGNYASQRNMAKFALSRNAALTARPYLSTADLGGAHEPEELLTVGPIDVENHR